MTTPPPPRGILLFDMVSISRNSILRIVCGLHVIATILIAGESGAAEGLPTPAEADVTLFTEITAELGLSGPPTVWPDGTYSLPELTGGGVALFDYDGDGDLDLLQIRSPPPGQFKAPAPNRLFMTSNLRSPLTVWVIA